MNQPIIFLSPCRRSIQFSQADHQTRLPPGSRSSAYDLARPDQTPFFGQTIKRDRLCQTRPDQLSFLPQSTHQGQHSLSVSLTLPQYIQPPPLGCHYHLLITGKVHSFCVCHGRLICKALDEPYQTYFPHTFGLKFLDFSFRLYLIVVREASKVPWAVKGLPCPFSQLGCFVSIRSVTGVWLFKNNFCLHQVPVRLFFGLISSFRRRQCHRLQSSLPLSCAKFAQFLYHSRSSLFSLCAGQVKLSLDNML